MILGYNHTTIYDIAKSYTIYYSGSDLSSAHHVLGLTREQQTIYGAVNDDDTIYYCNFEFKKDLKPHKYKCACTPGVQMNPCKHIVAVLFQTKFDLPAELISKTFKDQSNYLDYFLEYHPDKVQKTCHREPIYLFDNFNLQPIVIKKEIQMEVNVTFTYPMTEALLKPVCSISLKIGETKPYSIQNIRDFFKSIHEHRPFPCGKSFVFDPDCHIIPIAYKPLLLFLEGYCAVTEQYNINYYKHSDVPKMVSGKDISITNDAHIKQLLDFLAEMDFNLEIKPPSDYKVPKVSIQGYSHESIPLVISLTPTLLDQQPYHRVSLDKIQELYPLTSDLEYIFHENKIHRYSHYNAELLVWLFRILLRSKKGPVIHQHHQSHFIQKIYPQLKQIATINLPKDIAATVIDEPLLCSIYLDLYGLSGLKAKVLFQYGNYSISPAQAEQNDSITILRDETSERFIQSTFGDFDLIGEEWFCENPDTLFDFVHEALPKLQEIAEVYYSDEFRPMKAYFPTVRSRLGLSAKNLLEISFDTGEFDKKDLAQVFKAYAQRKKYIRLKNGAFLSLADESLRDFYDLTQSLSLDPKDISAKNIQLPINRALYLEELLKEGDHSKVSRMPEYVSFLKTIREPDISQFQLSEAFEPVLRDYQKQGFCWLKSIAHYKMGGILADDMGLGKTLQIIAFIDSEYKLHQQPSLVIAPTTLIYNWEDEARKFAPWLNILVVSGSKEERKLLLEHSKDYALIVTSYPLIRRDIELYTTEEYAYCIIDEAQNIKNPLSVTAEAVKQIRAGGFFALTGTPIENRLTELWSIFDFVMPGYLNSLHHFTSNYEKPIGDKDSSTLKRLKKQIRPFIIRRMKQEVLSELPPKIETKSLAQMEEVQKITYLAYLEEAKNCLKQDLSDQGYAKSQLKILAYLTRLRQICCHPGTFIENYTGGSGKIDLLKEILKDALEANHRILLFSQFTSMLGIIRSELDLEGITYSYLDGNTKALERNTLVHNFNGGTTQVFLISLKAGGTGLNLTSADVVIHFDPWWNPAVEDQATDRAYRIGQKNTVQVFKLIAHGTIEEKIYEIQQRKKEMVQSVIEPGETLMNKLSEGDIRELFGL